MSNLSLRKYALKNSGLVTEVRRLRSIDRTYNERENKKIYSEMEKMKKEIIRLKDKIKKMNTVQKGRFKVLTRNVNSRSDSLTKKEKEEKFIQDVKKPIK